MGRKVYLAGPINGCSDAECMAWRRKVNELIGVHGFSCVDPMLRDYRGLEEHMADSIVDEDKQCIQASDIVLVNASRPSWGTAMEVFYATEIGKTVIAFTDAVAISPWLRCHTTVIFDTLEHACLAITERSTQGMR